MPEETWSFAEASIGVVAACLPTLGPLFSPKRKTYRAGRSIWRSFRPNGEGRLSSSDTSRRKVGGTSLADLPLRRDRKASYKAYASEVGPNPSKGSAERSDYSKTMTARGLDEDYEEESFAEIALATSPAVIRDAHLRG